MVVHRLTDNRISGIFPCLIVLIISVSLRPVEGRAPQQALRELTRIVQLKMMLGVVVCLIVVVMHVAILIIVFSCRIVPSVRCILVQIDSVPGYACVLVSVQPGETQGILLVHPSQDSEGRLHISIGIPDITVCHSAGIGHVKIQSGFHQSRSCGCRRSEGIERAIAQVHPSIRICPYRRRTHVYAGSEGARTICRRAQSALELDAGKNSRKCRNIHPEHLL